MKKFQPILVTESNEDRINAAVEAAQKNARARTIKTSEVFAAVRVLEERLDGVRLADRAGVEVKVCADNSNYCGSYKWPNVSTCFTLRHNGRAWVLAGVAREGVEKNYLTFYKVPRELQIGLVCRDLNLEARFMLDA